MEGKQQMTNEEFIAKLTRKCDTSDIAAWLEWEWEHPQLRELSGEPQFRNWFNKAFNDNGCSESDEHYAYLGETEIEKELGGRLSWLSSLKYFGKAEHLELSDEDDSFPLYADAFDYDEKKYWVLTMVGHGSISWLMTDEAFKKEYQQGDERMNTISENKAPIVINLFGPPGSGKSTGAAEVFAALKKSGVNAELVTEFAKDKTWEHNATALGCQEYVFGKQSYRLARCRNDVDVIVTDSPLPLSIIYNHSDALGEKFNEVVLNVFDTYRNYNYYINRVKPYNSKGRNQTEAESDALGEPIKNLLNTSDIEYKVVNGDDEGYQNIINEIKGVLGV